MIANTELFLVFLASFASILLGLITLFKNYKSITNLSFFLFSLSFAFYNIFNNLALSQSNPLIALFWVRIVMLLAVFINLFYFLLADAFPKNTLDYKSIKLYLVILFTLILVPITQTHYLFSEVEAYAQNPKAEIAMPFFLLHTVLLLFGGFFILLKKLKKHFGHEKQQIKILLWASILLFSLILFTNVFLVLVIQEVSFAWLLPFYTLLFIALVSYSIIKHKMLNISRLVARSVAYFLLIVIMAMLYVSVFFLMSTYFLGEDANNIYVSIALAMLLAFTFQPLKKRIGVISDSIFYKGYYDSEQLLNDLSITMASNLLMEDITHKVLEKILSVMKISHGLFILIEEGKVYQINQIGYSHLPEFDEKKVQLLIDNNDPILTDELDDTQHTRILNKYKISLGVPLFTEGMAVGFLGLGEKLSGDLYTANDINLLSIVAPVAAVAIQNSKKYEEIRRFNVTLEQEIEKATKKLQRANSRLKVLDKLKDEFVSLASHELRTPMTSIKNYLWMALNGKGGKLSEKQKYYLSRSYESTDRLIELVNDMLNISRIESGRMTLQFDEIDLPELAAAVIGEVEGKAKMSDILVKVKIKKGEKIPTVIADSGKIKEVLINLVGNALKFTPEKGTIIISFVVHQNHVEVAVTDSGVGISPENQKNLFKKFGFMKDSYEANQDSSKGSGLGLYLSKEIVNLHKGIIGAESAGEGKGSRFFFTLQIFSPQKFRELAKKNTKRIDEPQKKV